MKIVNLGYLRILRIIFLILLMAAISACGTVTPKVSAANHSGFNIQGFLVESDGVTPISGATISLLTEKQEQVAVVPNDVNCAEPSGDFLTYTCSIEDGSFNLHMDKFSGIPLTLKIEYKEQIQNFVLDVDEFSPKIGTLTFVPTDPNKEKVAIVMDFYNPFDDIREFLESDTTDIQAAKHQLLSEYQNIYNISSENNDVQFPTFYSLFIDSDMDGKADIHDYQTLYINSRSQSDIALLDQSIKDELADFIANGGNLYITEWRIELEVVEPSADEYI